MPTTPSEKQRQDRASQAPRPATSRARRNAAAPARGAARPGNRRIIVYIATSADGYIARKDGGVEWLDRPRPAHGYGMGPFLGSIDAILWGRTTYGFMEAYGGGGAGPGGSGPPVRNYVFSHGPAPAKLPESVEWVSEPVADFARRLRAEPGKNVWMMGGAGLIGSFLDAGEIDEFMIHVIPTFIGEGIPLIQPRHRTVPLELLSAHPYEDGVVRLHYAVGGRGAANKAEDDGGRGIPRRKSGQ